VTTSASQIEVSKAAFVPVCLKAHVSGPSGACWAVIQFAMAKTVPRNWPAGALYMCEMESVMAICGYRVGHDLAAMDLSRLAPVNRGVPTASGLR
jgi:hypothetical protein